MAGASLLTLLDDIATILDDVAVMSKVAAKKTAGVLGDDLALNAQQVTGVAAERELPVVWAVAKGSFRNKLILVPAALLISAFVPWLVTPLLMLGGLFLCFEGFEKVYHSYTHRKHQQNAGDEAAAAKAMQDLDDLKAYEQQKVKGAIRTDFVLSAEIIAISLGVVAEADFTTQMATLSVIAILMTVGVYGLVAGIVKLDDLGLYMSQRQGNGSVKALTRKLGLMLVNAAPYLMKGLTIIGTAAMFMVGGGILTHGVHWLAEQIEHITAAVANVAAIGPVLAAITPTLLNAVVGIIAGAILVAILSGVAKLKGQSAA
ncbi:DUF808 domain-containing protein [Shewanella gelidii]|uniref:Membrane protein n=1 Tax=Shewanella gelidii TaxID=1642821 RepID=A0A917JJD7_9GAMM|nr:DUF808 domain-containing protein [Shewanella gelidii]MCL1097022.1 DUF808 domain-containing protein [Shewanella gelidii]GGI71990.1 membrane protein [Shewanella gelidii]